MRAALQSNFQHKYLPGAVQGIYDYWVTEDRLIPMTPEEARQHSKPLTRNYEEGESSASAAARETSPSQEATSSTPLMTAMPPGQRQRRDQWARAGLRHPWQSPPWQKPVLHLPPKIFTQGQWIVNTAGAST